MLFGVRGSGLAEVHVCLGCAVFSALWHLPRSSGLISPIFEESEGRPTDGVFGTLVSIRVGESESVIVPLAPVLNSGTAWVSQACV